MQHRKAIGNVIAAVVMVFLMVLVVSELYVYNLDELDNYNQVAQQVFNTNAQRQSERISIQNVQVNLNHGPDMMVNLTVVNTGGVTVHIVAVYLDDLDSVSIPHVRLPKSIYIGAGLTTTINGLNTTIPATNNDRVKISLFTELGNSVSVEVLPPGLIGTSLGTLATTTLTLVPPNPIAGNDMVVLLTVQNNANQGVAFTSLTPDICLTQGSAAVFETTIDTGAVTAAGSNTLTAAATKTWGANQFAGDIVMITSGTGAGQAEKITGNTAAPSNQLDLASTWTTQPDSSSEFAIRTNCHSEDPVSASGKVVGLSGSTFTVDNTTDWAQNEFVGYDLQVINGSTNSQPNSYPIIGNSATQGSSVQTITVSGSPSGVNGGPPSPFYSVVGNLCNAHSGLTLTAPVTCTQVQSAVPPALSFLPSGGSATFQWIYEMSSLIADSPVTVTASYVNMTTTIGLISCDVADQCTRQHSPGVVPIQDQMPDQVAVVRGPGGASGAAGGNFQNAFGSLVNLFLSFQFTQDGKTWSSSSSMATAQPTIFRLNLTNLSPKTIAFNSSSSLFLLPLTQTSSAGTYIHQLTQFFVMQACYTQVQPFYIPSSASACVVNAYPASRYFVGPGQTIALYFGASTQGGSTEQSVPDASGSSFLVVADFIGSIFQGQNQLVALGSGCSIPGTCSIITTLSPAASSSTYNVVVQTSWAASGPATINTGCTPQPGCLTSAGVTVSGPTTTGFTLSVTTDGVPCPDSKCSIDWGVYGPSTPYSQAAPYFVVNII